MVAQARYVSNIEELYMDKVLARLKVYNKVTVTLNRKLLAAGDAQKLVARAVVCHLGGVMRHMTRRPVIETPTLFLFPIL